MYLVQKGQRIVSARSYGDGFAAGSHREYGNSALNALGEVANKAWWAERDRQRQAAAKAREDVAREQAGQRANLARKQFDSFVGKTGIQAWPALDELTANPFVYEGKIVGLMVWFDQMIGRDRGIFDGKVVASDVPTDTFRGRTQVLLAGRVLGSEPVETPFGGKVSLPHLKFVDVYKCHEADCADTLFWKTNTPQ